MHIRNFLTVEFLLFSQAGSTSKLFWKNLKHQKLVFVLIALCRQDIGANHYYYCRSLLWTNTAVISSDPGYRWVLECFPWGVYQHGASSMHWGKFGGSMMKPTRDTVKSTLWATTCQSKNNDPNMLRASVNDVTKFFSSARKEINLINHKLWFLFHQSGFQEFRR